MLVDSHVHLDRYDPFDRAGMLARARAAGVERFLTVGVDVASSREAVRLAATERGVLAAVGVHPLHSDPEPDWAALSELAAEPGVVAIGEIGLDQSPGAPALDCQTHVFQRCLELASRARLPIVVHQQFAIDECLSILSTFDRAAGSLGRSPWPSRGVCHYFQGDLAEAIRWLSAGYLVSLGKPTTRPECRPLRQVVAALPLSAILLETDTYPLQGRSTEPADVRTIAETVAELKAVPMEEVAQITSKSFDELFGRKA